MLCFNLYQFTDPGSGAGQEPDHKIPVHVAIGFQGIFESHIIFLGDHAVQKRNLLRLHHRETEGVTAVPMAVRGKSSVVRSSPAAIGIRPFVVQSHSNAVQVPVDPIDPVVDRGSRIVLHQIILIQHQIGRIQFIEQGVVEPA